jgi:hypothetical protein
MPDLFAPTEHDHGCQRLIRLPDHWMVNAEFDGPADCYRTKLSHRWAPGPTILFGMMNPSGASLTAGDMTVMRTGAWALRWGFGAQMIGNACAYRAVSPSALLVVADPVGPRNHAALAEMAAEVDLIVVAHGNLPRGLQPHADAMVRIFRSSGKPVHVLRLSLSGVPMHPMARGRNRLPDDLVSVAWDG